MTIFLLWLGSVVITAIVFYFVGRNNPNIAIVNKLIAAKKIVVDTTGKVLSAVKSA
jgi:hypothetical protein